MEHEGYQLIRRIGAGGSGTVWEATDPLGARVAIKMLHPGLAATEAARARLVREATTVNRIQSDAVAHVVDVEADQTQPFVVSEFIDGPNLADRLKQGPLPAAKLTQLAQGLMNALIQVHASHVIHRDIKPSNVILSPGGPVLIDFGIAMGEGDEHLTTTGLVSGTLGFTAPELLQGAEASTQTDWWGWAATLLNAATGRPPFGSGQAALTRTLAGQPDTAGLPRGVAQVLRSALAADASQRPHPADVCEALGEGARWDTPVVGSSDDHATEQFSTSAQTGSGLTPPLSGVAGPTQPLSAPPEHIATDTEPMAGPTEWLSPVPEALDAPTQPISNPARQVDTGTQFLPATPGPAVPAPTRYVAAPLTPAQASYPYPYSDTYPDPYTGGWGQQGSGPEPGRAQPYVEHQPRPAASVIAAVLAVLAALPIFAGFAGSIAVVVVLVAFATLGTGQRWREHRRVRYGQTRGGDTAWAIVNVPWHLLKGGVGVLVSLVFGAVAGAIAWAAARSLLKTGLGMPDFLWLPHYLSGAVDGQGWTADPLWQPVIWAVLFVTLVVAVVLPTSAGVRRGIEATAQTLLAPWWARLVFTLMVVGVLAASWDVTTGSGLG